MASETFNYFISRTWRKWRTLPPSTKGYYQYNIFTFQTPDTRQVVVFSEVEYVDEKGQHQTQEFGETTTFTALTFDMRPRIRFKSAALTQNLIVQVHWVPVNEDNKSQSKGTETENSKDELPAQMRNSPASEKELNTFQKYLNAPADPLDRVLAKSIERWTEDDVRRVMKSRMAMSDSNPEKGVLANLERKWFGAIYDDGPATRDAAGRLIDPKPLRLIPEAVDDFGGKQLDPEVSRIGAEVIRLARTDGLRSAVRVLQRGINRLIDGTSRDGRGPGAIAVRPLKEDGLFGRKTKKNLYRAIGDFAADTVLGEMELIRKTDNEGQNFEWLTLRRARPRFGVFA